MYLPRSFETTPDVTHDLLRAHPFAMLVARTRDDEVEIVHLPLLVEADDARVVRLTGHVARANPFARVVESGAHATAAFVGPHAYVSASWYEHPHEQVPTWNYAVVHVCGALRRLDDAATVEHLRALAARFEEGSTGWHPGMLDETFFADLRRGIVGFALEVEDVQAKLKMSQNRSPADRARVRDSFASSDDPMHRAVAALMAGADAVQRG